MPAYGSRVRHAVVLLTLVAVTVACTVGDEQERALGQDAAAQIEREVPMVADDAVNAYVTNLGTSLATASDDRNREWQFRVVDAEILNAFALPGGFVYVNRGLIEHATSSSELAGVLGHEIGHVLLRHSAERIEKQQKTSVGVSVVCGLTNICSSDAARVAINVGGAALFARFSRRDEMQADSAAVGIVMRAGYSPQGIATMFEKLLETRDRRPDIVAGWFASHPMEEERIATVVRIIRSTPQADGRTLVRDDPSFHEFQARIRRLPPPPAVTAPSGPP